MSLISELPSFYEKSKYVKNIMECDEAEINLLIETLKDLKNQFFIDSATWGLEFYEIDLGIEVDKNKPYDERREVIKAKIKGQGTTTIQMIKDTAKAFTNGEVDIIEDYEKYHFIIKFISIRGIPKNIEDFKDMIRTIKPAHLTFAIEYTYNTWGMIKHKTWGEIKHLTWNELKSMNFKEVIK